MKTLVSLSVLAATGICAWTAPAQAGPLINDQKNDCAKTLCRSVHLKGIYERSQPWGVQVYAKAGECLRVEVTSQSWDMEMGVLSPDVQENHYVDDDSGGSFRPRIEVDPTPVTGWYVAVVSDVVAAATRRFFDLRYGRYPGGNANCSNVTPVSAEGSERSDRKKAE